MRIFLKVVLGFILTSMVSFLSFGQCPANEAALAAGGTFSGTCTVNVGADIVITGDVIWTSGTLTIDGAGGAGDLIVDGTGSIDIQGGTITMDDGSITINNGANVVVGATGTLESDNAEPIVVSGTMDVFGHVETFGANGGDINITGAGAYVTIYSGGHIECSDDFQVVNEGTIELQTGSTMFFNDNFRNNIEGGTPSQGIFIINGIVNGGDGNAPDGSRVNIGDTTPDSSLSGGGTINIDHPVVDDEGGPYAGCAPGTCIALPVEFVSFNAKKIENQGVITWVTASEINNKGFYVEKSTLDNVFYEIGFVLGNGTTSAINKYSFEDTHFTTSAYYRLRQVDYDGAFEYSNTIHLSAPKNDYLQSIAIYPNPSSGRIRIEKTTDESYIVTMIDMRGIRVLKPTSMDLFETENKLNQILPYLSNGLYMIRFTGQNRSFETKIVLQK